MPNPLKDMALRSAFARMMGRSGGADLAAKLKQNTLIRTDLSDAAVIRKYLSKGRFAKRGSTRRNPAGAKQNQTRALRYLFTKLIRSSEPVPPGTRVDTALDRLMSTPRAGVGKMKNKFKGSLDDLLDRLVTEGDDLSENEHTRMIAKRMANQALPVVYERGQAPPNEMRMVLQALERALRN